MKLPSPCAIANLTIWPRAYPPANGVAFVSTVRCCILQTKRRPELRMSTPGSRPASQRIWKPLHIPSTRPPSLAKRATLFMIGAKRAIAPQRR